MTNGDGLDIDEMLLGTASSKSPNSSSSGSWVVVFSIFDTFVTVEDDGDKDEVTSEDGSVTEVLAGLVTALEIIALRYSEEKSKLKLGTIGKLAIEFRSIVALGLCCRAATSPMLANNSL